MLLTQTEMIYARGVKDLLCNPRYAPDLLGRGVNADVERNRFGTDQDGKAVEAPQAVLPVPGQVTTPPTPVTSSEGL